MEDPEYPAWPHVDFVGSCTSLDPFATASIDEIYASHVYEHLGFNKELPDALAEAYRVLKPGGIIRISVPDFETLCKLFLHPQLPAERKFDVMMHIFGGQEDEHDFHKVGLTWDFLASFLHHAGFRGIRRVEEFNLFDDFSSFRRMGILISLNVEAAKQAA